MKSFFWNLMCPTACEANTGYTMSTGQAEQADSVDARMNCGLQVVIAQKNFKQSTSYTQDILPR